MKYFEKTAGLSEWWENRKEDVEYAKMLAKHKYYVYKGGKELGAPTWDLIKHDWSKLKPSIWAPYREAIIAEKIYEGGTPSPETYKNFREAVKEHTELEPHHDYKYNNPKGNIVPNLENFADWWAVSKAKDSKIPDIKTWLLTK